ncbi:MAG: ATP-binding protein [Sphaerochaeta sp.]|jgi:anti-sigma regulatory factor (Ser/Thr protein kinase)|nr:ATP-binding protein [Sphaerochaeta sp.]MCI2044897.1 ATP-binding protein [Sphaerochaeta sp.]MCI2075796.1 ATP-binding protein [Sphaerochaeta sp.]MCI2096431.1 ATP-binding protein [Sphaerochaeta sp.]
MHAEYAVPAKDFSVAGAAASAIKQILKKLGINPLVIKRIVVATFEAEVNVIAHSYGGKVVLDVDESGVTVQVIDTGPGIPDLNLAMQEGWSTASDEVRALGYGAGMGLPNIKKNADKLDIVTKAGDHTHITMFFKIA